MSADWRNLADGRGRAWPAAAAGYGWRRPAALILLLLGCLGCWAVGAAPYGAPLALGAPTVSPANVAPLLATPAPSTPSDAGSQPQEAAPPSARTATPAAASPALAAPAAAQSNAGATPDATPLAGASPAHPLAV